MRRTLQQQQQTKKKIPQVTHKTIEAKKSKIRIRKSRKNTFN
jgi:hypothetical protein